MSRDSEFATHEAWRYRLLRCVQDATMTRKDCDIFSGIDSRSTVAHLPRCLVTVVLSLVMLGCSSSLAWGGSIRVWPTAVVVDETILLSDLAQMRGFDREIEAKLAKLMVTSAPLPGGSRVIHLEMIRSVLEAGGVNMAMVSVGGATKCAVTRPAEPTPDPAKAARKISGSVSKRSAKDDALTPPGAETLRHAVLAYFNEQVKRYGGRADVVFDRTSQQVLDLSGPDYEFRVRRRGGPVLGLIQIEVDVHAQGVTVQTVPLVVQAALVRPVVVARRSINQGATIQASDVEMTSLTFTQVDKLGLSGAVQAVGQRAKRFIPSGSVIDPALLASVPLVERGQLVTLISVSGAVRIVTSGKALANGLLGETIAVRSTDKRRVEYDGVVVGPGRVQMGSSSVAGVGEALAVRSGS